MAKQERRGSINWEKTPRFFFFSPLCYLMFSFLGRAQRYRDHVVHLEYANSWQCICLLVLDLPLGGRSPTQLRSLSAVCLQTPVILPHSATLRQSHFSTSHPRCVCLEAVGFGWGRLVLVFFLGGGVDLKGQIMEELEVHHSVPFYYNCLPNFPYRDSLGCDLFS